METAHYIVTNSPNNTAFIEISDGKLVLIDGDLVVSSLLELKAGKPVMSERAVLTYDIFPVDEKTFEFNRKIYREESLMSGFGKYPSQRTRRENPRGCHIGDGEITCY